ncbi:MAG: hypothetical protein IPK32_14345 [Verrucomicrobiaceae bacterium]|nr:hypothetical protein [Verrucomicrobiaceae bacterium]
MQNPPAFGLSFRSHFEYAQSLTPPVALIADCQSAATLPCPISPPCSATCCLPTSFPKSLTRKLLFWWLKCARFDPGSAHDRRPARLSMPLIDTLESKFGRFAIPGLIQVLAVFQLGVLALLVLLPRESAESYIDWLRFNRDGVLGGQVWRLLTHALVLDVFLCSNRCSGCCSGASSEPR